MKACLLLPIFLLALTPLDAQHGSSTEAPFSTPEDAAAGLKSFRSQCAACHGPDATGGVQGPNLVTGNFKNGNSDEALFRVITKGVSGTAMVGFPAIAGRETWQIIAFLRSANIGRAAAEAKGDAARGLQVFESSGCGKCHTNGNGGGLSGPDLSQIGSRRSLVQLQASVLNPSEEVSPDYWSLKARTKSGQEISGVRLNEDMSSFQVREPSGRLRSVSKGDLASYEIVQTSPMPSFQGKISGTDLENLIAYLASLRAPMNPEVPAK